MKFFYIILFISLSLANLYGNSDFFKEGVSHYEKKEFDKAKFKFEQDIVFNPKSEKSYLYLSKIFNKKKRRGTRRKKFKHGNIAQSQK